MPDRADYLTAYPYGARAARALDDAMRDRLVSPEDGAETLEVLRAAPAANDESMCDAMMAASRVAERLVDAAYGFPHT